MDISINIHHASENAFNHKVKGILIIVAAKLQNCSFYIFLFNPWTGRKLSKLELVVYTRDSFLDRVGNGKGPLIYMSFS